MSETVFFKDTVHGLWYQPFKLSASHIFLTS